jgi:hypothetical protein
MKALVSPNEIFNYSWVSNWFKNDQDKWEPIYSIIENCERIAQVELDNNVFEVALPLHWVDCPNDCLADLWYFKNNQLYLKPQDVEQPED